MSGGEKTLMRVSYRWLSEYVDLSGISAAELAERLTRAGIEIAAVERRNQGVSGVVVGRILKKEPHPDADRLSVCTVDVGGGESRALRIVCGAPNVAEGQKVVVALPGATLPGGVVIREAKIRGVDSQGMICSAEELGVDPKWLPKGAQDGIWVLADDVAVGEDAVAALALDDEILHLELTPNRSDCLGMIGVAYETAALFGRKVRLPEPRLNESGVRAEERVRVRIAATRECPLYTARYAEGVRVGPSPQWLQNRLIAAGMRPINNVVDITNYVMLEYGQPLHAFDYDRIDGGEVVVRLARSGETIVTLDGQTRELNDNVLVIADRSKPVAIAGVMGGENSEVSAGTTRILLESARFDALMVRRAARWLGIRSEAALRFEKDVNPETVVPASARAASLLAEWAGASVAQGVVAAGQTQTRPRRVFLTLDRINRYLGTSLNEEDVEGIMDRLNFGREASGSGGWTILVPSRRGDVVRDVDLIEEIARLYGYDRIPATALEGPSTPGGLTREQRLRRKLRAYLSSAGWLEVVGYSLTAPQSRRIFAGLAGDVAPVAVMMPMSVERSELRVSLVPELLNIAVYNRNRDEHDLALFEIGRVFWNRSGLADDLPEERHMLAALLTGRVRPTHWSQSGKERKADFFDLKGMLEGVLRLFGVRAEFVRADVEGLHPGRTAEIRVSDGDGRRIGVIGQLHPERQRELELDDTYVCEIDLDLLAEKARDDFQAAPPAKFPAIARDAAVVVAAGVEASALLSTARAAGGPWLESADVFDVYTDERLGPGRKSVALSFVYRHPERTLTDEEAADVHGRIVAALAAEHGAELRG